MDRYDFFYNNEDPDDYESTTQGYWGYLRDKRADRSSSNSPVELKTTYDGYWGTFKDFHLDEFSNYESLKTDLDKAKVTFDILAEMDSSTTPSEDENLLNNANESNSKTDTCATKLIYDVYSSKFKIEAGKRDE